MIFAKAVLIGAFVVSAALGVLTRWRLRGREDARESEREARTHSPQQSRRRGR